MENVMFYLVLFGLTALIFLVAWRVAVELRGRHKYYQYYHPEVEEARDVFVRYMELRPLGIDDPLYTKVKYALRDLPDDDKSLLELNGNTVGLDTPMRGYWKVERNVILERVRRIRGECQEVLDQVQ